MSSRHLFGLLPVMLAVGLPAAWAQAPITNESAAIAEAAQRFKASGKPMFVSADKLEDMMTNPATAPALISVCAPDDHAKANIPGSVNLPRDAFWKPPMQRDCPIARSAAK